MKIYRCDRCKKISEKEIYTLIIEKASFDLCEKCIKDINDFMKYCEHGNYYGECKECNEEVMGR